MISSLITIKVDQDNAIINLFLIPPPNPIITTKTKKNSIIILKTEEKFQKYVNDPIDKYAIHMKILILILRLFLCFKKRLSALLSVYNDNRFKAIYRTT